MSIEVSWGNAQKTVVHVHFGETWTLEDVHNMIDDMYNLMTSIDHMADSIMDFTDSRTSPAKLLTSGSHVQKRTVSNSGISVMVKANGFLKAMTQLIAKMFMKDTKIYFADSLDEAYQIIGQHERTSVKS